jgi:DNA-binding GntR family transcriptional regulator
MSPLPDHRTLTERIADHLRDAIAGGELKPGEPVRQAHLAKQLGVSPAPLREALRQLESEGFVTFRSFAGASVTPWSEDEVREMADLRILLEAYALRIAGPNLTADAVRAAIAALDLADRQADARRASAALRQYRHAVFGAAGQPLLLALIDWLDARERRYLSLLRARTPYFHNLVSGHRDVLETLQAGDLEEAIDRLEASYLEAADTLAAALHERQASTPSPRG